MEEDGLPAVLPLPAVHGTAQQSRARPWAQSAQRRFDGISTELR